MTDDEMLATARRLGTPLPNDRVNGSIVVASVIYREEGDTSLPENERALTDEFTVILLNDRPPYYTVATITKSDPTQAAWEVIDSVNHRNIVPAVNGDHPLVDNGLYPGAHDLRTGTPGYTDMGGDY